MIFPFTFNAVSSPLGQTPAFLKGADQDADFHGKKIL
jgi:hypothetical protein